LEPVYTAYHTWHEAVPAKHGPDYEIAHGTTVYYFGRSGSLKGFGDWDDSTASIVHALKEYQ